MEEGSISPEAVTLCGQGRGAGMLLRVVECPMLLGRFDMSGLDSAAPVLVIWPKLTANGQRNMGEPMETIV